MAGKITDASDAFAGYTPAMRQFLQIKQEHPNLLLLYRMGDFYETFFEDAETVHRLLGLTLTSRSGTPNGQGRIPMAGIPFTTLDQYLVRLVNHGLSVGICEQIGVPGKGLMERRLSRIITPGTLTDDGLLNEKSESTLLAVCPSKKGEKLGLAWMTISSGSFRATEIGSDALLNEIARISPSEIVIPQFWKDEALRVIAHPAITTLPDWNFDFIRSEKTLKKQLDTASLTSFGIADSELVITAAGVIVEYAASTQCRDLAHITSIEFDNPTDNLWLDVPTRRNLEICQTLRGDSENTLLSVLDHCITVMGSRRLRNWLTTPSRLQKTAIERHEAVEALLNDISRLGEFRELLKGIPDFERTATRIALESARPRELAALRDAYGNLCSLSALAATLNCELGQKIARDMPVSQELHDLLSRAILPEPNSHLRDGDVIAHGYSEELDQLRELRDHSGGLLISLEEREKERTGIANLRVEYNSVLGYYIEISKGQIDKVPDDYKRRQTLKNVERYITPELKEFEDKAISALERSKKLERKLYEEVVQQCAVYCKQLLASAQAVSALDVLCSFALHADTFRWVRPQLTSLPGIELKAARHPVVERSIENYVPNDCELTPNRRLLVITGPNMGGKSTYMRSVALIALLCYCGSFVPAESAVIGPIDKILTRIGASDDLARGLSTFMVEMTEAAAILRQATSNSLVLMDEIGRGTSTFDGLSLAAAIAEDLASSKQCLTLFATHYFELTQLEASVPEVANVHVSAAESSRDIVFLHEILPGPASQSYGIAVAKLAGMPKNVIRKAKKILVDLEERAAQSDDMQLDLFGGAPVAEDAHEEAAAKADTLRQKLAEIDLNDISPRQAWDILHDLQKEAEKSE